MSDTDNCTSDTDNRASVTEKRTSDTATGNSDSHTALRPAERPDWPTASRSKHNGCYTPTH